MSDYLGFVIPECFIDTRLTQFLLDHKVNHQHSCNNVVKQMRSKYKDNFAVGIIDKDKHGIVYLNEFNLIGETRHLQFFAHPNGKHYIITVSKAMDSFIMDCASEMGCPTEIFGLPKELKDFTIVTKNERVLSDRRITELLNAIQTHGEIVVLKNALTYLSKHRYLSNPNEIRTIIQQ